MRARYYSPELRRFINADIIAGEIFNAVTLNRYAYANGNPVSNIDPFGLSAERGNNFKIISGLEGLYGLAYEYYDYVYNKQDRVNFANDAVMKYIIYNRFYSSDTLKGIAWDVIAGPVDFGFMKYMDNYTDFSFMQENNDFIDPYSSSEIDFVHMIATLNAHSFNRPGMGLIDNKLNTYAGWAGDLVTLAGNAQANYNKNPNGDISQYTQDALNGKVSSTFSTSDLLADIDAFLINYRLANVPIYKAISEYYSSNLSKRYNNFVEKGFGGSIATLEKSAKNYLSPSLMNLAFRGMFQAEYSNEIIPEVVNGFTNYIIMNLR